MRDLCFTGGWGEDGGVWKKKGGTLRSKGVSRDLGAFWEPDAR